MFDATKHPGFGDGLVRLGPEGKSVLLSFATEHRVEETLLDGFAAEAGEEICQGSDAKAAVEDVQQRDFRRADDERRHYHRVSVADQGSDHIPDDGWHFLPVASISEYGLGSAVSAEDGAEEVTFFRWPGTGEAGEPAVPHLWITFDRDDVRPSQVDAAAVQSMLGLAHWSAGLDVCRVEVPLRPLERLRIPTVLDAGVNPAWAPSDAPCWGMTRHLETDAPTCPELLWLLPREEAAPHGGIVPGLTAEPATGYLEKRLVGLKNETH